MKTLTYAFGTLKLCILSIFHQIVYYYRFTLLIPDSNFSSKHIAVFIANRGNFFERELVALNDAQLEHYFTNIEFTFSSL